MTNFSKNIVHRERWKAHHILISGFTLDGRLIDKLVGQTVLP